MWVSHTHIEEGSLVSPPIQTLISSRNIHRHTRNMFNQIFDHPMAQSSLFIKLSITVTQSELSNHFDQRTDIG